MYISSDLILTRNAILGVLLNPFRHQSQRPVNSVVMSTVPLELPEKKEDIGIPDMGVCLFAQWVPFQFK